MRRPGVSASLAIVLLACGCVQRGNEIPSAAVVDVAWLSVAELRDRVARGDLTAGTVVDATLDRIRRIDESGPAINAVLELNPDARGIALELPARAARQAPLYGVPVLLKANIDTGDSMSTHAGALAVVGRRAPDDAAMVTALRAAGAVIVGKANLSEWANFRSRTSVSGWSGVGGQTRNPHVLDRNPCGSSSGSAVAVAAGLVPLAIGTETDGSIICPSGVNGIVGFKPTVGMVSRDGIIPIAASQDTAGPMTRSVRGAAIAMQVLADPARGPHAFVRELQSNALAGRRIGVVRDYFGAASHPRVAAILDAVVAVLGQAGAVVVDPVEIDASMQDIGAAEFAVFLHEFGRDLDASLTGAATLQQIIAFNERNAATSMPWFGQDLLQAAAVSRLSNDEYAAALAGSRGAMRSALGDVFDDHGLDALVAPSNGPAWPIDFVGGDRFGVGSSSLAAISGRPAVTIPAGAIHGLPVGVSLIGERWADARLLGMAHALELLLPPPRPGQRSFRPWKVTEPPR